MKTCTKCHESKSYNSFIKRSLSSDGYTSRCKQCIYTADKARRLANPSLKQNQRLKSKYGLTYDEYVLKLDQQDHKCAICLMPETCLDKFGKQQRLSVDHNHSTNAIRGLLCSNCNRGLGSFKDNQDLLHRAIVYLNTFN